MKQLFTFCLSVCLFGALNMAQAQISLEILNAPDTVHVSLDTLGSPDMQAYWDVTNVGEESLDVLVTRSFIEMADPFNFPYVEGEPGSYERFCWGPLCYPFGTVASADQGSALVTLAPADTNNTFKADFYPSGVAASELHEHPRVESLIGRRVAGDFNDSTLKCRAQLAHAFGAEALERDVGVQRHAPRLCSRRVVSRKWNCTTSDSTIDKTE